MLNRFAFQMRFFAFCECCFERTSTSSQCSDNLRDTDMSAIITSLTQNQLAFTNLMTCIQIAMTLPVTSASCERTFSSMKLLKNWLRNRMGDQRLTDLLTLYTCKERTRKTLML